MKIAVIGDIRLNLPALEAILANARFRKVDQIWNVGNTLGDGLFPNETIQKIKEEQILSILGKVDRQILGDKHKKLKKSPQPDKWLIFSRIYEALTIPNREFLKSLNSRERFELEGKKILLINQLPGFKDTLTPEIEARIMIEIADKTTADLIIYCHPNQPSTARKIKNTWFVNTGSTGGSTAKKLQSNYCILDFKPRSFKVRQHRVKYHKFSLKSLKSDEDDDDDYEGFEQNPLTLLFPANPDQEYTSLPPESFEDPNEKLVPVIKLASDCLSCKYMLSHSYQVARLALGLFDKLQSLHHFGTTERFWLWSGAILHDIGWIIGRQGHHKFAFNIIINTATLPFFKRERFIIACLARYHRKSIPSVHHLHFATLEPADRDKVFVLTAFLRIADGLDSTHQNLVSDFDCKIFEDKVLIECKSAHPALEEYQMAMTKGSLLFETIFQRKLVIEWQPA